MHITRPRTLAGAALVVAVLGGAALSARGGASPLPGPTAAPAADSSETVTPDSSADGTGEGTDDGSLETAPIYAGTDDAIFPDEINFGRPTPDSPEALEAYACNGEDQKSIPPLDRVNDCITPIIAELTQDGRFQEALDILGVLRQDPEIEWHCHETAHTAGHAAYDYYESAAEALAFDFFFCSNGYHHGVLERFGSTMSDDELREVVVHLCDQVELPARQREHVCREIMHGIGHAVQARNPLDFPTAISFCQELEAVGGTDPHHPKATWLSECVGGIAMEYGKQVGDEGGTLERESGGSSEGCGWCGAHSVGSPYETTDWDEFEIQRQALYDELGGTDVSVAKALFDMCGEYGVVIQDGCYPTMVNSMVMKHAGAEHAFTWCAALEDGPLRSKCVAASGVAMWYHSGTREVESVAGACEEYGPEDTVAACLINLAENVHLLFGDLEEALAVCALATDPEHAATCRTGLTHALGR